MSTPPQKQEACRALHKQGLSESKIGEQLGIPQSTVHFYLTNRPAYVNMKPWLEWLKLREFWKTASGGRLMLLNGRKLENTNRRLYDFWRAEARAVTLKRADKFCCYVGLHFQHFLVWCYINDKDPWANEIPVGEWPIDDVAEVTGKVLARHLRRQSPFDVAWKDAVKIAKPGEGWRTSAPGTCDPIIFMRRTFKKEYEAALKRREERNAA